MSVLIRGMEMPENCFECPCCRHDSIDGIKAEQCNLTLDVFGVNNTERWIGRGQNCPLVEIKEPHGRLGDLDKLKAKFRHSEKDDEVDKAWNSAVRRIITQAETIIEPEGSEE